MGRKYNRTLQFSKQISPNNHVIANALIKLEYDNSPSVRLIVQFKNAGGIITRKKNKQTLSRVKEDLVYLLNEYRFKFIKEG